MLIKEIIVEGLQPGERVAVPGDIKISLSKRAKQLVDDDYFSKEDLKYFSLIEDVCSDFIKIVKTSREFIYRGMKNRDTTRAGVIYGRSFEQRQTVDTLAEIQEKVDQLLKIGGFKALRSNSIFVTSDSVWVERFGPPYIIFPKNGFNYTWSEIHSDWIPDEEDLPGGLNKDIKYYSIEDFLEDVVYILRGDIGDEIDGEKNINDFYKDSNNKQRLQIQTQQKNLRQELSNVSKSLKAAMKKDDVKHKNNFASISHLKLITPFIYKLESFEKQIKGLNIYSKLGEYSQNVYDLIKNPEQKPTDKLLKQYSAKFIKQHKLHNNKGIEDAIHSKYEIYINGEYIAFYADDYDEALRKYFKID